MIMNKYELTVVLDGKSTASKKKSFSETLEKILKILEGKVTKVSDWGVKELSYPIKKSKEGLYLFVELEMPAKSAKQLDLKLKMEESLLRYLLIRV